MVTKLLYVDTETTGLDPVINDPHQIAVIIEINNEVVHEEVFYTQPTNYDQINDQALETCNITLDKIRAYPIPRITYARINRLLRKYVDPYNPYDKFIAVGHNVKFDIDMLREWFRKHGNKFFYAFLDAKQAYDTLEYTKILHRFGVIPKLENNKLLTVCNHLGIELEAHDALNDIRATRSVYLQYKNVFDEIQKFVNETNVRLPNHLA